MESTASGACCQALDLSQRHTVSPMLSLNTHVVSLPVQGNAAIPKVARACGVLRQKLCVLPAAVFRP